MPAAEAARLRTDDAAGAARVLTAQELLAGSEVVYAVEVPAAILAPAAGEAPAGPAAALPGGRVRLRPLSIAALALISRAAHDDPALVPLLVIREGLVEPALTVEQVRRLHAGLVHFLVSRINRLSGLDASGEALTDTLDSGYGRAHLLLARHFGWTPAQVSELTPGQVAVYLAGVERLLELKEADA